MQFVYFAQNATTRRHGDTLCNFNKWYIITIEAVHIGAWNTDRSGTRESAHRDGKTSGGWSFESRTRWAHTQFVLQHKVMYL